MGATAIQWTDKTWNPVRGCSRVSPGCDNCYAMKVAHRFSGPGYPYEGLTTLRKGRADWSGIARFVPEMLDAPLRWRQPARIFVNSMSDLFHHSVTNEEIAAVFGVMAACSQHTFQVLTKRADRMREWFGWVNRDAPIHPAVDTCVHAAERVIGRTITGQFAPWPLSNVWLGVSAEDQQRADERIPHLLAAPAAVRFVSAEPLLGPLDLTRYMWPTHWSWDARFKSPEEALAAGSFAEKRRQCLVSAHARFIDWVIVGGESGPGARLADLAHHRSIIEQCRAAGVAVFHKQAGANVIDSDFGLHPLTLRDRKGGDPAEWPPDVRVRQFPEVRS